MTPEVLRSVRLAQAGRRWSLTCRSRACQVLWKLFALCYSTVVSMIQHTCFMAGSKQYCGVLSILAAIVFAVVLFHRATMRISDPSQSLAADRMVPRGFYLRHVYKGLQRGTPCTVAFPCKFKIIADLDTQSKFTKNGKERFLSYMATGWIWDEGQNTFKVQWLTDEIPLESKYNEGGRGFELSELCRYNGQLLTFDDRTGIVFELKDGNVAIARHVITTGDGQSSKGMKIEWATVRDAEMWIGSIGKEFTSEDGSKILNGYPFWVVRMGPSGEVSHINWETAYSNVRKALNAEFPGYVIHEAVNWSPHMRKWVFLPRRVSQLPYDDKEDESRGSNKLVICSEDFSSTEVIEVGEITPTRGFSSFKFLPGTQDKIIVALKSEENSETGLQRTYITVFTTRGSVLLDETLIPFDHKYEGIEFEEMS